MRMTLIMKHKFVTTVCFAVLLQCICLTTGEEEKEDTSLFNQPFFKNYNDLLEQMPAPTAGADQDNNSAAPDPNDINGHTKKPRPRPAPRYPDPDDGVMYMPIPNNPNGPDPQPCQRVSRVVNLQEELNWNFVSPNIVDIGMCTGYCPSLTASTNMHTRIRGLLEDDHTPCCVPAEFETSVFRVKVYLPHFDWYYTLVERRNDTVVKSCECR